MSLPLSRSFLAASAIVATLLSATAEEQPAAAVARFRMVHSAIDAAGGRSSTSRYEIVSSIGLPGNLATTPDALVKSGFPGQLNEPPVAISDHVNALRGRPLNIPISTLLQNDFDADGDAISLVSVPPLSANGIPLSVVGAFVVYDAPLSNALSDSFSYSLSDGMDLSVGTVFVSVLQTEHLTVKIFLEEPARGTVVQIYGIPRHTYQLQTTTDLNVPIQWINLGRPASAPADGLVEVTDTVSEARRFYRAVEL